MLLVVCLLFCRLSLIIYQIIQIALSFYIMIYQITIQIPNHNTDKSEVRDTYNEQLLAEVSIFM
jgi:Na+-transporting NADH:ubiquinone oxidoreductase subunit NqrF